MESVMSNKILGGFFNKTKRKNKVVNNLAQAELNKEYIIKGIKADDEELVNFLFTLGCYEGEKVTVISVLADNYVISVKDARYSIDKDLAEAIII